MTQRQNLIDKVVIAFDGNWPSKKFDCMHRFLSKECYCMNSHGDDSVCSKSEFENRAKALGYWTDDSGWYDYELQKAIKLPPVGTECQCEIKGFWEYCEVIHHTNNGIRDVAACKIPQEKGSSVGHLKWADAFRPKDWNRKAAQERNKVVDAVRAFWDSDKNEKLDDWFLAAYNAGFLKLPEGYN